MTTFFPVRKPAASGTAAGLMIAVIAVALAGCGATSLGDGADAQLGSAVKTDTKVALGAASTSAQSTSAQSTMPQSTVAQSTIPKASPVATGSTSSTSSDVAAKAVQAKSTETIATGNAPASAVKAAEALLATSTPGSTAYRVGSADVIEISVFKVPELSKAVQVGDNGTVNLALVGEVMAAGKTAQEIERDLTKSLGTKYLQNPQVTVFVREYNSQRVTVEGAVKTPGLYPVRGRSTLLQMLATCGGLTELADSTVLVFRQTDGKRAAAKFEVNDIRTGEAPDPPLQAGDVVVVNTSAGKEAFNNFAKIVPLAKAFSFF